MCVHGYCPRVLCVFSHPTVCVAHILCSEKRGAAGTALQVTAPTELMFHGSTNEWIKVILSFMKNIKQSDVTGRDW